MPTTRSVKTASNPVAAASSPKRPTRNRAKKDEDSKENKNPQNGVQTRKANRRRSKSASSESVLPKRHILRSFSNENLAPKKTASKVKKVSPKKKEVLKQSNPVELEDAKVQVPKASLRNLRKSPAKEIKQTSEKVSKGASSKAPAVSTNRRLRSASNEKVTKQEEPSKITNASKRKKGAIPKTFSNNGKLQSGWVSNNLESGVSVRKGVKIFEEIDLSKNYDEKKYECFVSMDVINNFEKYLKEFNNMEKRKQPAIIPIITKTLHITLETDQARLKRNIATKNEDLTKPSNPLKYNICKENTEKTVEAVYDFDPMSQTNLIEDNHEMDDVFKKLKRENKIVIKRPPKAAKQKAPVWKVPKKTVIKILPPPAAKTEVLQPQISKTSSPQNNVDVPVAESSLHSSFSQFRVPNLVQSTPMREFGNSNVHSKTLASMSPIVDRLMMPPPSSPGASWRLNSTPNLSDAENVTPQNSSTGLTSARPVDPIRIAGRSGIRSPLKQMNIISIHNASNQLSPLKDTNWPSGNRRKNMETPKIDNLFGFEDDTQNDDFKLDDSPAVAVPTRQQLLDKLKKLKDIPVPNRCATTSRTTNVLNPIRMRQMTLSEQLTTPISSRVQMAEASTSSFMDNTDDGLNLFGDPETTLNRDDIQRTYTRIPAAKRPFYVLSESECSDHEEEQMPKKKRTKNKDKNKMSKKEEQNLENFIDSFNSHCAEVESYNLIIE